MAIAEKLELIPDDFVDSKDASKSFKTLYNTIVEEVGPVVAKSYYDTGYEAYRSEEYHTAIENLKKAFQYDPENGEALYNLGNAYYKSGKTNEAVETFQQVIDKFPDTEKARKAANYIEEIKG